MSINCKFFIITFKPILKGSDYPAMNSFTLVSVYKEKTVHRPMLLFNNIESFVYYKLCTVYVWINYFSFLCVFFKILIFVLPP